MKRRLILNAALAGTTAAAVSNSNLWAQAYPSRPLKMIVPWPPGQATDLAGRVAAQELSKALGVAVVVENKAGAGGTIGTDAV
ncbi:MAG: tripartite tricarboxylate transporter substrate binding protein, partial [Betaproteobacteria bacterium]|nr:tripartite tricarboxylate transporter substrate binding protein [Betaproteobacteria bacterium]